MAKRTTTRRKPAARKRQSPPPALDWSLRPEHQRELFALMLITVAGITIVFFLTGSSGAIGQTWVAFTQRLLGWGALLVPLALGMLGVAILWQERREDLQLTGATVLGAAGPRSPAASTATTDATSIATAVAFAPSRLRAFVIVTAPTRTKTTP